MPNSHSACIYLLFGAGIFLLGTASASWALKADRDQPIEIASDSAERDEKLGLTLYHGNVVIRQGSVLIEAETVTIKTRVSTVSKRDELEEILTVGKPSRMQQRLESNGELVAATATTIQYQVSNDTLTLIENAELKQGERLITGDRISYDIVAEKVTAGGNMQDKQPAERVTVTLPPKVKSTSKTSPQPSRNQL